MANVRPSRAISVNCAPLSCGCSRPAPMHTTRSPSRSATHRMSCNISHKNAEDSFSFFYKTSFRSDWVSVKKMIEEETLEMSSVHIWTLFNDDISIYVLLGFWHKVQSVHSGRSQFGRLEKKPNTLSILWFLVLILLYSNATVQSWYL